MEKFSERLKSALILRNMTAAELSRIIGVNEGTISNYKKGIYEPKQRRLESIANALHVSIPWLMGYDVPVTQSIELDQQSFDYSSIPGIMPIPKTVKRPRLGTIACGEPILAEENFDGYDDVPDGIPCDFTLICDGDSMINARIHDGDIVYIKQQPTVENGQIAAIMIDGETTLKRVYIDGDRLTIIPENPAYKPHTYIGEELNTIRIIGLATGFTSTLT